jgi:hypothetical protein
MYRDMMNALGRTPQTTRNDLAVALFYGHRLKPYIRQLGSADIPLANPVHDPPPGALDETQESELLYYFPALYLLHTPNVQFTNIHIPAAPGEIIDAFYFSYPPLFHIHQKLLRGVEVPCGYEMSWWYGNDLGSLRANYSAEHGTLFVPTHPPSMWTNGGVVFVQMTWRKYLGAPEPYSVLPPMAFWQPRNVPPPATFRSARMLPMSYSNAASFVDLYPGTVTPSVFIPPIPPP